MFNAKTCRFVYMVIGALGANNIVAFFVIKPNWVWADNDDDKVLVCNTGYRCNRCDDGYYDSRAASDDVADAGDVKDADVVRECVRCRCNNNIDSNAVGNCDRSVDWPAAAPAIH